MKCCCDDSGPSFSAPQPQYGLRNCRADQRGLLTFLDQNKIDNTIVLTGGEQATDTDRQQ